ncbi:hypothetical protein TRIATDRAFT_300426, partial [Trichoderma atroviride IMI 206040]
MKICQMLLQPIVSLCQSIRTIRKAKERGFQILRAMGMMKMMRAHFPLIFKVKMPHPSNQIRAPANLYKAPRLPRSFQDKMNSYGNIIEDSDEDMVVRFTGPRSGRFLPLWHHVHEKSYS